jgi:3-methyl-2-oxobutanoate hydroxymethyltransferase
MKNITILDLQNRKNSGGRIAVLTCYDATFARIVDKAGVDVVLVGDSLGMVIGGENTTLGVTLDQVVYHTRAVARGVERAHIIADMPFMTYQHDTREALVNAAQLLKAGAHSVKLEGGEVIAPTVRALVNAGIPVMGHLGLMPQSIHALSGYRIQGKSDQAAERIFEDARKLQDAGAYAVVLECIPMELAARVTKALTVPTIGIGSGSECDGQVLVLYDMLGLNPENAPKFARRYMNGAASVLQACEAYVGACLKGQ